MRIIKKNPSGFTLVELLTVIGILAVIISLTLATISHMRKAAFNSNTAASIQTLSGAIEVYYQNFRAYPGPLNNNLQSLVNGNPVAFAVDGKSVTMTENLYLGLAGGMTNPTTYAPGQAGKGPKDLVTGKNYASFMKTSVPASGGVFLKSLQSSMQDSSVPEFIDSYQEPMPILYFRANKGAAMNGQYSSSQNIFWTGSPSAQFIGPPPEKFGRAHGLRVDGTLAAPNTGMPMNLLNYLGNPVANYAEPRGKDKFVLIAAGKDRTYGTSDDITSFGSVAP